MKKLNTGINEKWIDENGFLRIEVIEGAHIDLEALKADHTVNAVLTNGRKVCALYDSRRFFSITEEASDYLRSGILNKERLATAVLTNNMGTMMLVNFINKFRKPESPLKLFTKEEDALEWLKKFNN